MPPALMRAIKANISSTKSGDKPERGFVEDEQLWLGHQPAADGEHLLLAARQRAGALRLPLKQPRKGREYALTILRPPLVAAPIAAEIEILAHRQIGENAPAFRHVDEPARDDLRRLGALDGHAVEMDRTGAGAHDARDRAIERRLAHAVGAEHGDDLAGVDAQVDAAQNLGLAVAGAEVAHREQRLSCPCAASSFAAAPWPR